MNEDLVKQLEELKEIYDTLEYVSVLYLCDLSDNNLIDNAKYVFETLEKAISTEDLNINFIHEINLSLTTTKETLTGHFDIMNFSNQYEHYNESQILNIKQQIETWINARENYFSALKSKFELLSKLKFFKTNLVAIGANGSGKSTLSNKFKESLNNKGVVISAQKILLIPTFNSIYSQNQTETELLSYQQRDKLNKTEQDIHNMSQEFGVVLRNLISENISASTLYRKENISKQKLRENLVNASETNLDKTLYIWNNLITHRTLEDSDGMNFIVNSDTGEYPPIQMSDGEKVILFQIAQVLQAPKNGFIVVDEPEMFLHKSIIYKLWDTLETERPDCLFVYLTHDLDFAVSRTNAKKLWIKSFTYPGQWDIQELPENEIPEQLLYEILGSRKNILFCESEKVKNDQKLLSILFTELTIIPVGSCKNVINYTKAYNNIDFKSTLALGLIDSDFHDSTKLDSLKDQKVFSYKMAEYENLLLDEDFLKAFGNTIGLVGSIDEAVDRIKEKVISNLNTLKENQTALFVIAKINNFFEASHVRKSNNLETIETNLEAFIDMVKYKEWYLERLEIINEIVSTNDYKRAISVFNFKGGLHKICNDEFEITNFTDRAISFLQRNTESHKSILANFPEEILEFAINK